MGTPNQIVSVLETFGRLKWILTALGGGAWTVWLHMRLKKADDATAKLRKTIIENASQEPLLGIKIRVVETFRQGEDSVALAISVTLMNEGRRNLELAFDDCAVTVGRLGHPGEDGLPQVEDIRRQAHWWLPPEDDKPRKVSSDETRKFRVGQRRHLAFMVPIVRSGLHCIQVQAKYRPRLFDDERAPLKAPTKALPDVGMKDPNEITAIEQVLHLVAGPATTGRHFSPVAT